MHSRFETREMNRERKVIFEEMSMCEDTPDDLVYEVATTNVFDGNPIARPIIGTRTALRRINHDILKDYVNKEYTADSIVISVAGNFDENLVCELGVPERIPRTEVFRIDILGVVDESGRTPHEAYRIVGCILVAGLQ